MSKFFCITDLIRFMMKEADNLMKGSVHEDDFFIFHDALVLMTAKETWMIMSLTSLPISFHILSNRDFLISCGL